MMGSSERYALRMELCIESYNNCLLVFNFFRREMTPLNHIINGVNNALLNRFKRYTQFPLDFRIVIAHCPANICADIMPVSLGCVKESTFISIEPAFPERSSFGNA